MLISHLGGTHDVEKHLRLVPVGWVYPADAVRKGSTFRLILIPELRESQPRAGEHEINSLVRKGPTALQ